MLAYAVRRLVLFVPLVLGMAIVSFLLLLAIPGDPVALLLGEEASPAAVAELRQILGLDRVWYVRLGVYLSGLAHGDLGTSLFQHRPVFDIIAERLPATLELAVAAMLIAIVLGLTLGLIAALYRRSLVDVSVMLVAQLGMSIPVFWLGILLMYVFSVALGWLPAINRGPSVWQAVAGLASGQAGPFLDMLSHLVLPALSLGVGAAAIVSRLVRASVLEVLGEDFVRTARAKGLSKGAVILVHVLRNAMLPIISVIGLRFGVLLAGAVLTESVFAWPGLGQLIITAVSQRDLPLIQGLLLTFAVMFAMVTLVVDLVSALVDPRIRLR